MIWWLYFIGFVYTFLMFLFIFGLYKVADFFPKKTTPKTTFSIVIPFRNEAVHLPVLLSSIEKLNYPIHLFEIIFVDDASDDASVKVIKTFISTSLNDRSTPINIEIIKNIRISNSPKKDAITTAIKQAKNQWILTTDADCIVPENWLLTLDAFIQQKQPKMVVAPVKYKAKNTFLAQFQLLDFLSLQGATISGFGIDNPFLCNGANLAYRKDAFLEFNGFEGNNTIASGDDIFLFEKFVEEDSKNVQFIKSTAATVTTFPLKNWKDLINQRVRWAAKTSNYRLSTGKWIGAIVFLTNISLVIGFFLSVLQQLPWFVLIVFFLLKLGLDFFFFFKTASFFKQQKSVIRWVVISSLVYPFFSVWVVLQSLFFNYQWKGRSFKK